MLTEAKLSNFNKHEIEGAEKARELHSTLGYPGYGKYLWLLKHNKIKDSKVTIDDAKKSLHIFGEESATVKGKTTQKKQSKIICRNRIEIPINILKKHRKVQLMVDYMFVQGVQFLTTISHELKFRTVEALPITYKKGAKKDDILNGINKVIKLYHSRGLIVEQIHGDNEFECIRDDIRPV